MRYERLWDYLRVKKWQHFHEKRGFHDDLRTFSAHLSLSLSDDLKASGTKTPHTFLSLQMEEITPHFWRSLPRNIDDFSVSAWFRFSGLPELRSSDLQFQRRRNRQP